MADAPDKVGVRRVYLKDCRLSFPHLKDPSSAVKDGVKKRRGIFLFDPESDTGRENKRRLMVAVAAVQAEVFGGKKPSLKHDRKCVYKGEEMTDAEGNVRDGYEGMLAVKAATTDMPTLLHKNKQQVEFERIQEVFYAGCRVEAIVTLYGVKGADKGGPGIFSGLNGVRFFGDDEAFGAARVTADDFDSYDGEDDFSEGTAEADDLPF